MNSMKTPLPLGLTPGALARIGLLLCGFGLLYRDTVAALVSDWSTDPNFSHGFLIPFIALYMAWYNQYRIRSARIAPANAGLVLILLGMAAHVAGNLGAEFFMMRISMLITLSGIIIFGLGIQLFRAVWVPIVYLVLMIPIPAIIWNQAAFPLQLFAARLSSHVIDFIGIPVFREGNILHLSNTSLEVVDACSGLRSLTSLIALTGIFSFLAPFTIAKKWILFLSAVPIAVAVNVIRLSITAAMAAWISPETAHGFLHDMSGLIIFGAALVLVYGVYLLELKFEKRETKSKT